MEEDPAGHRDVERVKHLASLTPDPLLLVLLHPLCVTALDLRPSPPSSLRLRPITRRTQKLGLNSRTRYCPKRDILGGPST